MKIKMYDEMIKNIQAFEATQETKSSQLDAAAAEVMKARQNLNELLDKALDNPELAAEVGKVQGLLVIAEEKQRRLQAAKLSEEAAGANAPRDITVAMQNVQGEIRRLIHDGSLVQEEFQPLLDEINEHRQAYMEKLTAVLIKMHEVNKRLAHIQHSTASAVSKYTDKEVSYRGFGPEAVSESDFREWAWIYQYAYDEDLARIRKLAMHTADPSTQLAPAPITPDKITLKDSTTQMTTTYTKP